MHFLQSRPMKPSDEERDQAQWSERATEWDRHIGTDGDGNRRYHVHPVLMRMLGDVRGLDLLDAGCGTGYLSVRLARARARVTAIDYAPGMLDVARERIAAARTASEIELDCRRDSACSLTTIPDASQDIVVSNYVLQDLQDYRGALAAFRRVLRPRGRAVLILGHPCFDAPGGPERHRDGGVSYHWPFGYFDECRFDESWRGTDRATGERFDFSSEFSYYHRPLSAYWRAFSEAGFGCREFDEPVMQEPFPAEMTPEEVARRRQCAYSVAFHLDVADGAAIGHVRTSLD